MSSEINIFGKINDINNLRAYLVEDHEETWLQRCFVSLSPSRDILVIAHQNRMAILSSKWCSRNNDTKVSYDVTWQGTPESCKENEEITAVFCLPIIMPQNKSATHYNPEWTCIVIGFSTGYVRFYTESGSLLVAQLFHNTPVTNIKYHSSSISSGYSELNEEIYIMYNVVICTIIGIVLFNTLKACRNRLARVQANCGEVLPIPSLTFKKWKFTDQHNIQDCAIAGPVPTDVFHHLMTASLCGGFDAEYRNSAPQSTLMIAAGTDPFIGFHYAIESSTVPVISDVAKAVANRLKTALGGWLFGSQPSSIAMTEKEVEAAASESIEATSFRFGLYDSGRVASNIVISPLENVCAILDSLGRVSIVDIASTIVIRMLKGYRDAECGWLLTNNGKRKKTEFRRTLFLIIYVPKKGILEVWPIQTTGGRIASLQTEKFSRLLYTNNCSLDMPDSRKPDKSQNVCILLQPSGNIIEVITPFHCCMNDKDSAKARDTYLLKMTNKLLLEEDISKDKLLEGVRNLASNLKTDEIKRLATETLSTNKYITSDVLLEFLEVLEPGVSSDQKSTLIMLRKMKQLCKFYYFLYQIFQLPPDYESVVDDSSEYLVKEVCETLSITEDELDKLVTLIPTKAPRLNYKHVSFSKCSSTVLNLAHFLKAFDLIDGSMIALKSDVSDTMLFDISDLVCSGIMYSKCDFDAWKEQCQYSEINPTDLLKIIFAYWLNKQMGITINREMLNLYKIMLAICDLIAEEDVKWKKIRNQLANSKTPLSAITAAIVCRAVSDYRHHVKAASEIEFDLNNEGEKELASVSEWETITEDECNWNILISQLEDVTFLDSVLRYQPQSLPAKIYYLPCEVPNVTLSSILKSGKGSVSELVAKWIVSMGLNPEYLLYYDENVLKKRNPSSNAIQEGIPILTEKCHEAKPVNATEKEILELLEKLKIIFPYSVSSQNLLLNIAWEYILAWKADIGELKALEASILTLKLIPSPHIKHGCCCLIWTVHLSHVCECTIRLINKVGKLPKDRLCKQNIGLSEELVVEFIRLWSEFITIFMEAAAETQISPEPVLQYEVLWNNDEQTSGVRPPPLCQLVLKQKTSNAHILSLQAQCSRALLILTTFSIRTPKPISNLFDSSDEASLFLNIQSAKQFQIHPPNEKLVECRTNFLKRAIHVVINEVLKTNVDLDTQTTDCTELIRPATEWMSQILSLALEWSVSFDVLRRHQINELYVQGYDHLAEEIIPSVSDKETLGYELMVILGHRIKKLLKLYTQHFSEFSPTVTSWICSLEENENIATVDMKYLLQLALTVNQLIPEHSKQRYLINQVVDSVEAISTSSSIS